MQSFLQYRRFKKHVTAQYELHRETARASNRDRPTSGQSSPTLGQTPDPDLAAPYPFSTSQDLEKAGSLSGRRSKDGDTHDVLASPESNDSHEEGCRPDLSTLTTVRTQHSTGINIGYAMTGIEVRDLTRTHPEKGANSKVFVVGYEGEDDILVCRSVSWRR